MDRPSLDRPHIGAASELHILRNVDNDGSGPAGCGDPKGLMNNAGEVRDVLHQIVMLGAGARDPDRVAFLESVRADQVGRHLTGDDDQGNGVHEGIDDAGHCIGGAGPRRHQHHPRLAGRARITLRSVGGALLMARQDMAQARLVKERVIDRQDRAPWIAEQIRHTLVDERLHEDLRPGHGLGRLWDDGGDRHGDLCLYVHG